MERERERESERVVQLSLVCGAAAENHHSQRLFVSAYLQYTHPATHSHTVQINIVEAADHMNRILLHLFNKTKNDDLHFPQLWPHIKI